MAETNATPNPTKAPHPRRAVVKWFVVTAIAGYGIAFLFSADIAKYVTAKEITGVVVDGGTGKPIANAIAAIRFERNNTGHFGGPHCFRSTAVQTDAEGRFRFQSWTQENTHANVTYGVVTGYKSGYSGPVRPVYVKQSLRSVAGIAFSNTIRIPTVEVRVELRRFAGGDQERIEELRRLANQFTCRMRAEFDDMILLTSIRNEIASSPLATQKAKDGGYTPLEWIDGVIKLDNDFKQGLAKDKR